MGTPYCQTIARQHFQASLALYEEAEDKWHQAQALGGLGTVAHHAGTFAEAVQFYQRSLALIETIGDPKSIAGVLIELGHNLLRQGRLEQGEAYIRRGCEISQQIGDRGSLADSLLHLTRVYFWHGKFPELLPLIDEAQPIFEELGWNEKVAFSVAGKGMVLALMGDYEAALQQEQYAMIVSEDPGFQRFQAVAYWTLGLASLGTE